MEVRIFNAFRNESAMMKSRYLDLDNINHLIQQSKGGGIYDERLWRESYYFNMTDPDSGISIITTIGLLPNRKRSAGFLLIMEKGRSIFLKPFLSLKKPVFSGYEFRIGDLRYSVEGTDWRLKYDGKKVKMNIRFSPINRIYPYRKDDEDEWIFERIGAQHYEQFGIFNGTLNLNGNEHWIGPCFGHRDHSWGIRDWSSIDRYSLHCCVFSDTLAFNLWEGSIRGRTFFKGCIFDGEENVDIVEQSIDTDHRSNGREPIRSRLSFRDSRNRRFDVLCTSVVSVPFPTPGSLVHEGIGRMRCGDHAGYGLQEYLWHFPNRIRRFPYIIGLLNMIR